MKAVLFAIGVLGLTAFFSWSEPTLASTSVVSPEMVILASERVVATTSDQVAATSRNGRHSAGTAASAAGGFSTVGLGTEW